MLQARSLGKDADPAIALTGQQRGEQHVVAGADQHQLVRAVLWRGRGRGRGREGAQQIERRTVHGRQ